MQSRADRSKRILVPKSEQVSKLMCRNFCRQDHEIYGCRFRLDRSYCDILKNIPTNRTTTPRPRAVFVSHIAVGGRFNTCLGGRDDATQ